MVSWQTISILIGAATGIVAILKFLKTVKYRVHKTGIVLITGTSTGIGNHAAISLAKMGYTVFAGVRNERDAEDVRKHGNANLLPVILDVAKPETIDVAVAIVQQYSADHQLPVIALVNNAGISRSMPIELMPMQMFRDMIDVNYLGLVQLTKAMLPILKKTQGRIINISSMAGRFSAPFYGGYSASKHAVEAISDSLRFEMLRWGVSVSVVEPGQVMTAIKQKQDFAQYQRDYDTDNQYPHAFRRLMKTRKDAVDKVCVGPEVTTSAIIHALTSPTPRTRYPLNDAQRLIALHWWVSDRFRDWVYSKVGFA